MVIAACVNSVSMAAYIRLAIYVNKGICGWDMKININTVTEHSVIIMHHLDGF